MESYYKIVYIHDEQDSTIMVKCRNGDNILAAAKALITQEKYKLSSIALIKCYGCINDISNQEGHMETDGCLYQSQSDSL